MQLITIYLLLTSKTKGKLLNITQEQCFRLSKAKNQLILKLFLFFVYISLETLLLIFSKNANVSH